MERFPKPMSNVPDAPASGEKRFMCGCGLSGTFPFCDGTRMIARTEDPLKLIACGAQEPANARVMACAI